MNLLISKKYILITVAAIILFLAATFFILKANFASSHPGGNQLHIDCVYTFESSFPVNCNDNPDAQQRNQLIRYSLGGQVTLTISGRRLRNDSKIYFLPYQEGFPPANCPPDNPVFVLDAWPGHYGNSLIQLALEDQDIIQEMQEIDPLVPSDYDYSGEYWLLIYNPGSDDSDSECSDSVKFTFLNPLDYSVDKQEFNPYFTESVSYTNETPLGGGALTLQVNSNLSQPSVTFNFSPSLQYKYTSDGTISTLSFPANNDAGAPPWTGSSTIDSLSVQTFSVQFVDPPATVTLADCSINLFSVGTWDNASTVNNVEIQSGQNTYCVFDIQQ